MADAEALFAAHQGGLRRYLLRVVGHAETARDLTQDVFVRVAAANSLPPDDQDRRGWLFRIARNLAIDHQRRHAVRFEVAAPLPDAGRDASQDTALAVNQALASLDPLDRDVFLLRETAGLNYAEIAAACDLTVAAARSRLHRARLELRDRLRPAIAASRRGTLRTHHLDR